tara:strand:- start:3529 stop:4347 length:819 start_codon:yes stop_codon:yes gene_type:complete
MKPKVLFATSINDDYIEGALVMIYSIMKHAGQSQPYDIKCYYHDIVSPLSEENQLKLKAICPNIKFHKATRQEYLIGPKDENGRTAENSQPCYLSFELFREHAYDSIIWFDIDMLCINDISELLEIGIQRPNQLCLWNLNTGLFIVGKELIKESIFEHLMSKIQFHDGRFMNQGIIRNELAAQFGPLEFKYNAYPFWNTKMSDDVRVLHWAWFNNYKPWQLEGSEYEDQLWQESDKNIKISTEVGNLPSANDKKYFDMWFDYRKEITDNYGV